MGKGRDGKVMGMLRAWGGTLDLPGRGGSFGFMYPISLYINIFIYLYLPLYIYIYLYLYISISLYIKQGSIPGNAEASPLGCRASVKEDVMGLVLILVAFSRGFALQSPQAVGALGQAGDPHPMAPCIRTPLCSQSGHEKQHKPPNK